jgi:hypothetical protein
MEGGSGLGLSFNPTETPTTILRARKVPPTRIQSL